MISRARAAFVLAVALSVAGCGQVEQMKESFHKSGVHDAAVQRVTGVLDGVKKGGTDTTPDVQRAICLWFNGTVFLEFGTLSRASDLFLVWQNEGHIARRIASFEITGAEDVAGGAIVVSGKIEGAPFKVKVAPGVPLAWVVAP